jgi:hypothetical protein
MSSTSNSQNLLVNVFRPAFVYSAGSGFTPKLVLSNLDIVKADEIQTGKFSIGDAAGNVFVGSNVGQGAIVSNSSNVAIGVGAMGNASNTKTSVGIGYNALSNASGVSNAIAIGAGTNVAGTNTIIVGANSSTAGSNMILLGSGLTTTGDVSGRMYIGQGGISNTTLSADLNKQRVGIATTDPSYTLDVSGSAFVREWLSVGLTTPPQAAIHANGSIYATNGFAAANGSEQYPAYTFIDESGTGFYRSGYGSFSISSLGQRSVDICGSTTYFYGSLIALGSVNIGAVNTSAIEFRTGYLRDYSVNPAIDISTGGIYIANTLDVSTAVRVASGGTIRLGTALDISGTSIRTSGQVYAPRFVQSDLFHDASGTFDLSGGLGGGSLRLSNNITFGNVTRTTAGAFRVGSIAAPTIDISGSNVRADGTVQSAIVSTASGNASVPSQRFTSDTSSGMYSPATNQLGFATAGVQRVVISNDRVGIGRAVPSVTLDVSGDISANVYNGPGGTASAPHYTFSDDRTTGIFFPSANQIGFTAGSTERMRISNGNVGIGTVAPTSALEISGGALRITSGTGGAIVLSNGQIDISGATVVSSSGVFSNAATTSNSIGGVTLSNFDLSMSGVGKILGQSTTSNQIGGITLSNATLAATTIRNALTSWTIDMSAGNISNSLTHTSSNFRGSNGASNIPSYSFINDPSTGIHLGATSSLAFDTAGVQRMVISNTNVGIGNVNPQYTLDVCNNGTIRSGEIRLTGNSAGYGALKLQGGTVENLMLLQDVCTTNTVPANGQLAGWFFGSKTNIFGSDPGVLKLYRFSNDTPATAPALAITATQNVGIGTSNPTQALEVQGSFIQMRNPAGNTTVRLSPGGITDTSGLQLSHNTLNQFGLFCAYSNGTMIFSNNSSPFVFSNAGAEHARLTAAGNLGIGTATPSNRLTVAGNIQLGTSSGDYRQFIVGGGNTFGYMYGAFNKYGDGIHLGYNFYVNDPGTPGGTTNVIPRTDAAGTSRISLGYGTIGLYTGGTNTEPTAGLLVSSNANVGIGTATPTTKLTVVGDISSTNLVNTGTLTFNSGDVAKIYLMSTDLYSTNAPRITHGSGWNFGFFSGWTGNLSDTGFFTFNHSRAGNAGTFESMRIDASGRVGIGTVNPRARLDVSGGIQLRGVSSGSTFARPAIDVSFNVPEYELRGAGDGGAVGFMRLRAGGIGTGQAGVTSYIDLAGYNNTTDTNQNIVFGVNGTERMRVLSGGNVGIGISNPSYRLDVLGGITRVRTSTSNSLNSNTLIVQNDFLGSQNTTGSDYLAGNILFAGGTGTDDISGTFYGTRIGTIIPSGGFQDTVRMGFFTPRAGNNNGATERMSILSGTSGGRVGINTTAPAFQLDVSGIIRGSSNIVAVDVSSWSVGSTSTTSDTSFTITYSPKQSSAANVRLMVHSGVDAWFASGGGFDGFVIDIRNNATVLTSNRTRNYDQVVDSRTGNVYGNGNISTVTVSGNVVSLINMRIYRSEGDDAVSYKNVYLAVSELSTT